MCWGVASRVAVTARVGGDGGGGGGGSLWPAREGCLEKVRLAINLVQGVADEDGEARNNRGWRIR